MDDPAFLVVGIKEAVKVSQIVAVGLQCVRQGQYTAFVGLPEQVDNAVTPLGHDGFTGEEQGFPVFLVVGDTATGNGKMDMNIPLQVTAKGMQGGENAGGNAFLSGNGLYGFGSNGTERLQQRTVEQKKGP